MSSLDEYGKKLDEWRNYIFYNLFSTKKIIKANTLANLFKGTMFAYILILMYIYQNFQLQSYIYFVLHGSYGIFWVCKTQLFPDFQFEQGMTFASMLGGIGVLSIYMIIPYEMISKAEHNQPNYNINRILLCCFMYIFGVTLMMVADCQKYYELKYKPKDSAEKTIKSGVFYCTRNPNYFGEMLLYLSFAILSNSYISYCAIFFMWSTVFVINITLKEFSFMRKPDWNIYKKHSWIILPKVFPHSTTLSLSAYALLIATIVFTKDSFRAF